MNNKFQKYYVDKLIEAIIFSKTPTLYFNSQLFSIGFLNALKAKIINLNKQESINYDMKSNLYELIYFIQENSGEFAKDNWEKINQIIRLINCSEYEDVFFNLYAAKDFSIRLGKDICEGFKHKDKIFEAKEFDFIVLNCLLGSKAYFEQRKGSLCLNEFYFFTINIFINECPELLRDPKIFDRIMDIVYMNKDYSSHNLNVPRLNKRQLRKIKKKNMNLEKRLIS